MNYVEFYRDIQNIKAKYAVIVARYDGKWIYTRKADSNSYEIPGGEIGKEETPEQAANRFLTAFTGAKKYDLNKVEYFNIDAFGVLFFAEVYEMVEIPESKEKREIKLSELFEENLTYPQIEKELVKKVQVWLNMQSGKGEVWDVYDKDVNLTGRTHVRGTPLEPGDYHLVVHSFIQNSNGELLIQKRSPNKGFANFWEIQGGSAVAGDDSLTAVIREAKEECGIELKSENGKVIYRSIGDDRIHDMWLFRQDFDIENVVLQENETVDAKWATMDEVTEMYNNGEFINFSYIKHCLDLINNM